MPTKDNQSFSSDDLADALDGKVRACGIVVRFAEVKPTKESHVL